MISIVLIGTGNVARHLFNAFAKYDEINVIQVVGRNENGLAYFKNLSKTNTSFDELESADIYIIAVSDDAISSVSQLITNKNGVVVHTSGSVPIDALSKHSQRGVFYPLQTFSKERDLNFRNVPICLESEQKEDLNLLNCLAHLISDRVYEISSEQRKSLHLAAVFVNNFTNHLYQIGSLICEKNKVPFEILKPLIQETAIKIEQLSPYNAQTGPARRGDEITIKNQLKQIDNQQFREIYKMLSQSIEKEYQQKSVDKKIKNID